MNPKTDSAASVNMPKPRISLFFATAGGTGYLPKAPGTWGSLAGIALYFVLNYPWLLQLGIGIDLPVVNPKLAPIIHSPLSIVAGPWLLIIPLDVILSVSIGFGGVFASNRVAKWSAKKDPQFVVVDEVSGQFLTYLFALAPANWKYLVLGFILFRVFDIWKPFPVRQAESLPGGWGIMADDWVAAIYAAIGIWIARALGL